MVMPGSLFPRRAKVFVIPAWASARTARRSRRMLTPELAKAALRDEWWVPPVAPDSDCEPQERAHLKMAATYSAGRYATALPCRGTAATRSYCLHQLLYCGRRH